MLKYKIVDNFLNDKDFNQLSSLKLDKIPSDSIKIYHNEIDKNNKIISNSLNDELILTLNKNYHQKTLILKKKNHERFVRTQNDMNDS